MLISTKTLRKRVSEARAREKETQEAEEALQAAMRKTRPIENQESSTDQRKSFIS